MNCTAPIGSITAGHNSVTPSAICPARPLATHAKELSLALSKLRSLLVATGYKTTAAIDRFDVKRAAGAVIGVDLMRSDGTVIYLPVEAS